MVELKVLGAVLVAVFASLMGVAAGNDMRRRVVLLQSFYRGILMIHQEIEYLKTPLEEAARQVGSVLEEPWASFFEMVGKQLEELPGTPFHQVWEEKGKEYLEGLPMHQEDFDLITQTGIQLGHLDAGENSTMLTVFEKPLEALIEEAKAEYQSKAQLYRRLGVMGGIFLVIIFV